MHFTVNISHYGKPSHILKSVNELFWTLLPSIVVLYKYLMTLSRVKAQKP